MERWREKAITAGWVIQLTLIIAAIVLFIGIAAC
jgi:hypothetical protein